jgi:uncharacterized protein (TIRG00374 family)
VHKKNLILILKIAITIGILAFIFSKIPIADVWLSLKQVNRLYVSISFLILIGMRYVAAYRIKIFTNVHKMKISIKQLFEISLMTSFYGLFLPGTLAGGAVRWYKISKADKKPAESLSAIVYDRFISILGLIMVGAFFWLFERQVQTNQEMGLILFVVVIVFVACYVLAFNGKTASFFIKMNDKMVFIPEFVREKIKKILVSSTDYRKISKRKHIEIFIVSILHDFCGILSMYLFSLSLDLPLTFVQLGWIRSIVSILSMLPISFAGIGVREGSMIFLLQAYGIESGSAIALSFLILSGNIVLALCGGLIEIKNLLFSDNSQKIVATNKVPR